MIKEAISRNKRLNIKLGPGGVLECPGEEKLRDTVNEVWRIWLGIKGETKKKHGYYKGTNVDIANITLQYLCSDSFSRKQD